MLAAVDVSAQEYTRVTTDEDGPPIFWRGRFITYSIDLAGCPDTDMGQTRSAVVRSFNTWESQACTDIFFSYAGLVDDVEPNHFTQEADGINLVMWLLEWPEDWSPDSLAQTSFVWNERTGEILDADIVLNGEHFYWTASSQTVTDIENVLTHEIGHLLGFGHTSDPGSTMYDGYVEGETEKRDLDATDIRGLCEIYPAGRSTPDIPELGMDELELSTGGCECSASPRSGLSDQSLLACLLVTLMLRLRRT